MRWLTKPAGGCSLAFDRPDIMRNKLMATCLEGKVHLWDMKTKHVKAGYAMHEQRIEKARHTVWGGRFLRQNREVRERIPPPFHENSCIAL